MELVVVFMVSVGIALLNSLHVIIQWFNNAPGETFTGIAHSFTDYFLYTAQMAQGALGRWGYAEHLFTNEPVAPTWYYWFNVTLGHIGSLAGLSPFATYNISLLLLVTALCLVWYSLTKTLYPTNRFLRLTSWMMILTTTSFFSLKRSHLFRLDDVKLLGQFWFSPAPVFNRLGGVPYQVFQTILFILLAIVFTRLLDRKSDSRSMKCEFRSMGKTLFVILFVGIAGSANPVQMLTFAVAAIATAIVTKITRPVVMALLIVVGGTSAWETHQEFAHQAVFTAARVWELAQRVPNTIPVLLLSIGPILFFIPFGLQNFFKQIKPVHTGGERSPHLRCGQLLTIWGLLSFILFLSPIPRLLGVSPVRFLHPVPYASLAILASEGLFQLSGMIRQWVKNKISLPALYALLFALYLVFTLPAISRQLMDRITPAQNPQLLMDTIYNHVPAPIVEALGWLKASTSDLKEVSISGVGNPSRPEVKEIPTSGVDNPVVLVDPAIPIEVLVPVFTGKRSFSGHPIHTLFPDVKEALRQQFFTGLTSNPQTFLSDHRIGYIIAAPTSVLPPLPPSLVTEVYKNTSVTIYKL